MVELSNYRFSTFRKDDVTLYRGAGDAVIPILMVVPGGDHDSVESIKRLEREYSLKSELDADWAAQPIELTQYNDRMALVLKDPGGEPLDQLLGQPLDLPKFLRIAIPLAGALRRAHERGLIHKDIKPTNVLVNMASGVAWLTGFGIASHLQREHREAQPPELIAGTLAYMAPEQTGRMNRSIDSRCDLYSLGVTFYEMLTGTLPFATFDPVELIHCHIARQPEPLVERVPGIPATLSAIILKLMAKDPEDRYQTARGVEADLRRCLGEWESTGRIERFRLAVRDLPDRLVVPERLYGRSSEVAMLADSFERVARDGRQALVLVSGYSGVGKSSVVNELQQVVISRRGLFAAGKFEPHERDIPFAPIVRAFHNLMRSVLLSSEADLRRWREEIRRALGANARLITDLVPEVALVIGPQEPVPDLPPQQAEARFRRVLQRFVGAFARPEHPLVLFVDDLQWLDRASLAVLRDLATHDEAMHLLLIGAYRQNEVGPTHPLSATLSAIRDVSFVQEIEVAPLRWEDIGALISDALHQGRDRTQPLADVAHEKTGGNPFFVIQFLHELADERCLAFDFSTGAWTWDLEQINAKGYTENVFELLAGKLDRLSATTRDALRDLAFLNVGRTGFLSIARGYSESELHAALAEATKSGFVTRGADGYAFCHDRIREAAYALAPESERAAVHLRIGRSLLAKLPQSDASDKVFDVVGQLNSGAALVTSAAERLRIAEVNLLAGRRARATSAYQSALMHLATGETLLSDEHWALHYALRFPLALYRAECEFLTGDLAAAEERLSQLWKHAVGPADLSAVTCLRMAVCTTLDRTDRAVEIGLEQLRIFGVHLSVHPGAEEVREEYDLLRRHLVERPVETLVGLRSTSDPNFLGVMEVLLAMLPAAVFTDKNLHDLAVLRMCNFSLEHGHCDASIMAYAHLSMALGPRFGDYRDGFRFGNLASGLAERDEFARYRGKVYTVVGYHVLPWTRPIQEAFSLMQRAYQLGVETGDLLFAGFSSVHLISLHLASGDRLQDVDAEAQRHLAYCRRARFGLLVYCLLGQLHLVHSLRGERAIDPRQEAPADPEPATLERTLDEDPRFAIAACWYWIRKLQACFHEGDYASALQMAARSEHFLWTSPTYFELAEYHFYSALAHAKAWDSAAEADAPGHRQALAEHHARLASWAANCVETFGSRAALVSAELARLEDRALDAERLYEAAIRSASAAGAVNVEAIASEAAGHFHRARGFERIAQAYFANAHTCYRRWGAEAVARRLEACSVLTGEPQAFRATDTTISSLEGLDLAAVLKASQTISGEILIDKLIETLMRTAVEHAGAERGLLIVPRGGEARIEAEATTRPDGVAVRLLRTPAGPSILPDKILNYALRTQEAVILGDALVQNPFSGDGYLSEHRVRSLLCLPLVKQATLVGVIYLENNLASHVFTPTRVAVLKLLASQAAISLENTRLYGELEEREAKIRRLVDANIIGIFIWDLEGRIIEANDAFLHMLGYDREDFASGRLHRTALTPPEWGARTERAVAEVRMTGTIQPFEKEYFRKDGNRLPVLLGAASFDATANQGVAFVLDLTERKRAEADIRESARRQHELQTELAHASRVSMMGQLTASIAHEVAQPLVAVRTNASAGLRWLKADPPNVDEISQALERIVLDVDRGSAVVTRIRAMVKRAPETPEDTSLHDAIEDVLTIAHSEVTKHGVQVRRELAPDLPPVRVDRVQIQQVLLNLVVNAIDAMSEVTDGKRELVLGTEALRSGEVCVSVRDTGPGIDPAAVDTIFQPFHTTKEQGLGMGLSICRSIVESHGGKLWAGDNAPDGAVFQFTLPAAERSA